MDSNQKGQNREIAIKIEGLTRNWEFHTLSDIVRHQKVKYGFLGPMSR